MTTDDGNKLIAVFMNYEYEKIVYPNTILATKYVFPLVYHSLWEWLMPVIEKISKIKIYEYEDGTPETAYPRTFGMTDEDGNFMFRFNGHTLFSGETLIEAAWNAVVDFIENNNSPKQTIIP